MVLLVSMFLTSEGILVGVGLTMLIVVIGINLIFMLSQVKEASKKKEMMDKISHIDRKNLGDTRKR
ncbi:hypothetical protein [Methanogenium cariaci]|uniref:hypothetical protein n=1 Tax=Methanogenium cariaci TaxID=2197 RepID=UPI001FDF3EF3|nr:hypothetical protein [Methanogenium cariaci]